MLGGDGRAGVTDVVWRAGGDRSRRDRRQAGYPTDRGPTPDEVAILNINKGKVEVIGQVEAPAAMIGPPAAVAVAKNGSYALVTACQKFEDGKLVPDDVVSVIDLSVPSLPKVIQTAHAGPGASGVSISPNGKLALVASTGEDAISVFSISGKHLTPLGKVAVAPKTAATDVVFTPDGKTAIVIGRGNNVDPVLAINGTKVTDTGRTLSTGRSPYGAVVTPDGKYLLNTNLAGANPPPGTPEAAPPPPPAAGGAAAGGRRGGRGGAGGGAPRTGTVAMTDIKTGQVVASVDVGPTPEHVALSGDGKYAAVVVANGSANDPHDAKWGSTFGLFEVLAVGKGTLTPLAQAIRAIGAGRDHRLGRQDVHPGMRRRAGI